MFVGRQQELILLKQLLKKRSASLVVVRGRRRIGKSRLAQEYGRAFRRLVVLTGLAPRPGITAQQQRDDFAAQLARTLKIPKPRADDWGDLFWLLAQHTSRGRVLVVLDEITWMGEKDPDFLGKLKSAWDLHFKSNPQLVLILSGSVSTWIDKNILSSTGFVGRVTLELVLEELPLHDCARFWGDHHVSAFEKLKVLAVTGGVPRYLEEIIPTQSAEQNIERLCFRSQGLLYHEFDRVFSDLFERRTAIYRRIVEALVHGAAEAQEVYVRAKLAKGGVPYSYLEDLVTSGFVSRDYTWILASGIPSKLSRFRLRDNYTRFYLKYIDPMRGRLRSGAARLPRAWHSILGLQFENMILNNRNFVRERLGVESRDVVADSPFFQRSTKRQRGCQIDYLVQDRFGTLYACEVKFSFEPLDGRVVDAMRSKLAALKVPRNMSIRPVLIHAGGVSDAVIDSEYFAEIIDAGQLLER